MKTLISLTLALFLCVAFATEQHEAYFLIEQSSSGVIGAILGGITAGVSIIFAVLMSMRDDGRFKLISKTKLKRFLTKLKRDVILLVWCLIASLFVPYLRVAGVPLVSYTPASLLPSRGELYTTIELFAIVIAGAVIIEIVQSMFMLFSLLLDTDEHTSSTNKQSQNDELS